MVGNVKHANIHDHGWCLRLSLAIPIVSAHREGFIGTTAAKALLFVTLH